MRPRVLFCWELGEGRGHLAQLSGLAAAFEASGWETFAALQKLDKARSYFAHARLLQAPTGDLRGPLVAAKTWSDILRPYGWTERDVLSSLVGQWRLLADLVQPTLIVLDSAPTALLALGDRWPVRRFSVPFFQPPPTVPLPSFVPGDHRARERELLRVAEAASGRQLGALAEMMRGVPGWVSAVALMDPWEREVAPTYVGPSLRTDHGEPVQWPDGEGPRIFAYLNPSVTTTKSVLQHLRGARASSVVSCALPPAALKSIRSPRLRISSGPFRISEAVAGADLAITHSPNGTASAFLAAGLPVLLVPRHYEQSGAADPLCAAGVAVKIGRSATPTEVASAIQQALQLRQTAERLAPAFVSMDRARMVEQMAAPGYSGESGRSSSRGT